MIVTRYHDIIHWNTLDRKLSSYFVTKYTEMVQCGYFSAVRAYSMYHMDYIYRFQITARRYRQNSSHVHVTKHYSQLLKKREIKILLCYTYTKHLVNSIKFDNMNGGFRPYLSNIVSLLLFLFMNGSTVPDNIRANLSDMWFIHT